MLDIRYYYLGVTLVNLLLLYTLWSWKLFFFVLIWGAFRVGFPVLLRLRKNMPNFRSLGEWAVITGATDGIGKSYAKEMAKSGLGVVLISRNQERLDNVADEIRALAGPTAKIRTIAMDFTDDIALETVKSQLDGLEIGVLINNVGMSYPKRGGRFLKSGNDLDFHRKIIRCNVDSMVLMSTAVLPQMQDRRKGLVINVGSFSSESQTPFMSVYASTKAFVESFSFSLAQEFAGTGVRIICTKPGFVITKMIENMVSESVLWPGPDAYVESHLKTAAIIPMTNGYWFHDVLSFVGSIMKNVMPFVFVTLNTSVMRPRGSNQTRKTE